ncbi:hypothetical protein SZ64_16440 [Erythrobacter sp. SG61-1L]|uniref:hypothetical protein n=1 Tax=Erythrobacter sp. SG61-1L TaxID=1603897 RepID=UPI0006C8EF35|nr:hypothetical protein [Erythrobacter sp. SG61-1L]KPL69541.1 hypothetical protein SZ64_16440 [Erythrobacter sp. SG61-1L]
MSAVKPVRLILLAMPTLLLAACNGDKKQDDERTASGQVLQGTISDEMLPLDKVTSEPPLMKEGPRAAGPSDAASDASAEDAAALDAQQPAVPAADGGAAE